RFAGWIVDRVGPIGADWIETLWERTAQQLVAEHGNTWKAELPVDHAERVERMKLSLPPDTVPFCVWMAAHHLDGFAEPIGKTISVGGDCDTNAAIVGGIVALSAGRASIPQEWL